MRPPPYLGANQLVEERLEKLIRDLERVTKSDVVALFVELRFGIERVFRDLVESRKKKREKLTVIVETPGGYIEVVQRIVDTTRHHYGRVEFIVPDYAMSAGTVLVMSGDAIYMDYFSVLGPIDPQFERKDGKGFLPAVGYLTEYENLIRKSGSEEGLTTAEMAFLIEKFDPAELYNFKQARQLSITLLKEWLVKYKFKDWTETETTHVPVTPEMRRERAENIAKILNDTSLWHSHGRGIPLGKLTSEDDGIKLKITDFGKIADLRGSVRDYHALLADYMVKMSMESVFHIPGTFLPIV